MFRLPSTFELPTRPNFPMIDVFQVGKGNMNENLVRKTTGNAHTFFKGALAKQVKTDDLSSDDIIIAVMGPSGSGKSSFINTITGLETAGVGHGLESCTSEVSNVRVSIPEMAFGDLVFVDTPGFDNTHKKDIDILKMVADWLKSTYEKNLLLSGLLYFHRISDNQVDGKPLKNLRVFEELCGKNALQNVILTTTMWDEVDEKTGEDRERELKANYWRNMLEHRSTTSRFLRTRESAFNLICPLIEAANRRSSVLLQDELVVMRKSLPATAAGQELFSTVGKLVSQREDLLCRIRHEMRRSDGDKMTLEPLQEEHQKLQNSLEATVNEMRRLRLPLGQRFLIMTDKFFSSKFESLKSLISKRLSRPAAPNTESPTPPIDSYAPVSHADYPPTTKDQIDCNHQSPPGSTSDTPLPIANGSNVLGRGFTCDMDRFNRSSLSTTKETQDNTVSSYQTDSELPTSPICSCALAPVSLADHHPIISKDQPPGSTSDTSLPIASGSNVLGQGPTSGADRSNCSNLSTTKETQDNTITMSSHISTLSNQLSQFVYSWTRNQHI